MINEAEARILSYVKNNPNKRMTEIAQGVSQYMSRASADRKIQKLTLDGDLQRVTLGKADYRYYITQQGEQDLQKFKEDIGKLS